MKNVENENDAIRNLNQKFKKQTSHEQQKTVDSSCISFYASSEKRQLKSSQVDKKTLSALAVKVNKLQDAV